MKLYQYALLMRSAGCVINDYADRNIDPHVKRTRERPLAAKRVTEKEALILFAILCLIAFGLVLLINALILDFQYQWHLLHKPAKFP